MLQQKFIVQVTTLPDCDDITRFDGTVTLITTRYCTLYSTLVLWEQGVQAGEEEEGMRGRLVLLGRAPATKKTQKVVFTCSQPTHHRINGFGCFSPLNARDIKRIYPGII
jgi:hypothetical protein